MRRVKEQYGKIGGVLAYHVIQSFKPGETDAKTAHEIGVEFASKLFGDKYEVLVTTHTDTKHIHNHILLNSVSYITGEKYHDGGKRNLDHLRSVSDTLCREHGLSVIKEPKQNKHMPYNLKQEEQQGKQTIRDMIREDIDEAILHSRNLPEFFNLLRKMDYEVSTAGKYLRVKPFGRDRFFRVYNLGKDYTEEAIIQRIKDKGKQRQKPMKPVYSATVIQRDAMKRRNALYAYTRRHSGFASDLIRTYLYYRNTLKRVQKKKYPYRPAAYIREDLRQLQSFSDQAIVLYRYNIHTLPELNEQRTILNQEIGKLNNDRNNLRKQLRTAIDETEIALLRSQIAAISAQIKPKYREVKLLDEVEKRSVWVTRKAQRVASTVAPEKVIDKNILSR